MIPQGGELRIGRQAGVTQIQIDEHQEPYSVSRMHCTVQYRPETGQFLLTDKSLNGTYFADGRRLEKERPYVCGAGQRFYLYKNKEQYLFEVKLV